MRKILFFGVEKCHFSSAKPGLRGQKYRLSAKTILHYIKQELLLANNIFTVYYSHNLKRDENGEWRKLHNEELHSLYRSTNIVSVIKSRRLRWAGHVARMKEVRSAFKILTGRPVGKRPLGRPRRRWENNMRMNLKK